ncbi:prepilin-type N-terminal cleavage/methylation domain-containing protein [Limosilactobacillus fermentum]|nr:prepilin-type N-terminal cleavage/methylation domain-containing protein [Limosilactobacillus fermentum]
MFNSQRRAFTMVEVVIVLAISALVIVTTTIPYQKGTPS